jgi:putative addiction module component (TIGR02574 family)
MSRQELIKKVLSLKPQERYAIVEAILRSLDQPDEEIEKIWKEECDRRVLAIKEGRLGTIPYEEIF